MAQKKWYDNAVMVNRDPNWYGYIKGNTPKEIEASLRAGFGCYDGAVTDVLIGVFEQTAMTPNDSFMWRGDKYLQKKENGHDVDYSGLADLYNCFKVHNVDAVQVFIDVMHELGIRPWLTFRMNDVHFNDDATSFLHSDMFYEEVEARHIVTKHYPGYGNAFSFKYPRYKTALLGYIKEMLNRKYDVFGIELDFMREIYCFDYIKDKGIQEIMLDYVREIKAYVTEIEKRCGHDIKISIRTAASPIDAYQFGFDIKTMVDEGLVDVVVPTPRWAVSDSGLGIRKWRDWLGDDVAIIGGIEHRNLRGTQTLPEQTRAYAASYYAQGADGIYFTNHEYDTPRNHASWAVNKDNCHSGHREFLVTYQDIAAYPENQYKPLPLTVKAIADLPLELGKVRATDKVRVVIDFDGEMEEAPTLTIGKVQNVVGKECERVIGIIGKNPMILTDFIPLEYDMTGIETNGPVNLIFKGNGIIRYVNVIIDGE